MSIQTEIDRISGNVSAALSAIAEKGVTVTDGSTSDALASLIASIEAGGGKIANGTYTPNGTTSSIIFNHGLGVLPNLIVAYTTASIEELSVSRSLKGVIYYNGDRSLQTTEAQLCIGVIKYNKSSIAFNTYLTSTDVFNGDYFDSPIYGIDENEVCISAYAFCTSGTFCSGKTYNLVAAVV